MTTMTMARPAASAGTTRRPTDAARALKWRAHRAGLLYLLMSGFMIFGFMYVPGALIVSGDATATAMRIEAGESLYRLGLLAGLISHILFVVVVLSLYRLFEGVDRNQARLMVALVCVGAAAELMNLGNRLAPLVLLSGADWLAVVPRAQLEALAYGFIRLGNVFGQMMLSIWGLWLFPFGILVLRSRFVPRILGWLLFASGAAYVAGSITSLLFPARMAAVSGTLFPLYMAELGIVFWLAFMGAKVSASNGPIPGDDARGVSA